MHIAHLKWSSQLSRFVQSAAHQAGRHLASVGSAMEPSLYPNGGTYHHPIAVFLVSGDGSLVYYTTDGTPPDETSSYVTSRDLIVIESSVTVRAVAVHRDSSFASTASTEVEATFVVHSAGQRLSPGYRVYITNRTFRYVCLTVPEMPT